MPATWHCDRVCTNAPPCPSVDSGYAIQQRAPDAEASSEEQAPRHQGNLRVLRRHGRPERDGGPPCNMALQGGRGRERERERHRRRGEIRYIPVKYNLNGKIVRQNQAPADRPSITCRQKQLVCKHSMQTRMQPQGHKRAMAVIYMDKACMPEASTAGQRHQSQPRTQT